MALTKKHYFNSARKYDINHPHIESEECSLVLVLKWVIYGSSNTIEYSFIYTDFTLNLAEDGTLTKIRNHENINMCKLMRHLLDSSDSTEYDLRIDSILAYNPKYFSQEDLVAGFV